MIIQEIGLRRNASSTDQSRGQKVQSDTKSDILDDSIDEDKYPKGTGKREVLKYLERNLLSPH